MKTDGKVYVPKMNNPVAKERKKKKDVHPQDE